jgi:3-oxoacyl-[acyl-carrier-protein] synthase II
MIAFNPLHRCAIVDLSPGVRRTWKRLLDSQSGIVSIKDRSAQFAALPSQVAAVVPQGSKEDGMWNAKERLTPGVCLL